MNDVKDLLVEEVTEEVTGEVVTGLTRKQKIVGIGIGAVVATAAVAGGVLLYKKVIKPRIDARRAAREQSMEGVNTVEVNTTEVNQ